MKIVDEKPDTLFVDSSKCATLIKSKGASIPSTSLHVHLNHLRRELALYSHGRRIDYLKLKAWVDIPVAAASWFVSSPSTAHSSWLKTHHINIRLIFVLKSNCFWRLPALERTDAPQRTRQALTENLQEKFRNENVNWVIIRVLLAVLVACWLHLLSRGNSHDSGTDGDLNGKMIDILTSSAADTCWNTRLNKGEVAWMRSHWRALPRCSREWNIEACPDGQGAGGRYRRRWKGTSVPFGGRRGRQSGGWHVSSMKRTYKPDARNV